MYGCRSSTTYPPASGLGVIATIAGSLSWAVYGLAQKCLLNELSSPQILLLLYVGAVLALLPAASPATVRNLDALHLGMLAFCCLNTIVGYGAFAESLRHWDVSRVGAVLATSPLFTMASMGLARRFSPALIAPEALGTLSVLGAFLVVAGSAACALAGSRDPQRSRAVLSGERT